MTYYIYTPMLVWAVTIEMQRTPLHEVGFASASWGGVSLFQRCSVCILVLDLGPWRARGSQAQGYPYFRSVLDCGGLTWAQVSTQPMHYI